MVFIMSVVRKLSSSKKYKVFLPVLF